jgi:hypothetical protein
MATILKPGTAVADEEVADGVELSPFPSDVVSAARPAADTVDMNPNRIMSTWGGRPVVLGRTDVSPSIGHDVSQDIPQGRMVNDFPAELLPTNLMASLRARPAAELENAAHVPAFQHPDDCPFGRNCDRDDRAHFREYRHPNGCAWCPNEDPIHIQDSDFPEWLADPRPAANEEAGWHEFLIGSLEMFI